jgi:hypothetical protein
MMSFLTRILQNFLGRTVVLSLRERSVEILALKFLHIALVIAWLGGSL